MKDSVIHKLTLLDTAMYRAMGLNESPPKYRKEQPEFKNKLFKIYSKLELKDLEELLKIKQGK
jgi:7,8-dihydro-6-hydroxymethylpterin-pyrophosphokinase